LTAILAGSARQPLFSVILSQYVYLSVFVRKLLPLELAAAAGQPDVAWRNVSTLSVLSGCSCT